MEHFSRDLQIEGGRVLEETTFLEIGWVLLRFTALLPDLPPSLPPSLLLLTLFVPVYRWASGC